MQDKLDTVKFLNRSIVACWVGLIFCLLLKIFGGDLFEIICTNENFIAVCDYADTHLWAYYLIGALHCFISLYFYTLAILQRTKFKNWELVVVVATVLIGSGVKIWNSNAGWIFDIWQFWIIHFLFLGKKFKEYWKVPFAFFSLLLFQIISLITRNLNIEIVTNNGLLIGIIYSIDITLMLVIYFLYSNAVRIRKEK